MHQNKPALSEVLNFERDIAPYPLTMIYAGVGSGKNRFVEQLIMGNEALGIPKETVMLITSRKAKVDETLNNRELAIHNKIGSASSLDFICCELGSFSIPMYTYQMPDGEVVQTDVVYTNARVQSYLEKVYDPNVDATLPYNRFSVIVWDEVHSLITDSTYQSSPYHVMRLIEETYNRIVNASKNKQPPRCRNIICMTGTPEAFEGTDVFKDAHVIDLRRECRCVQPGNIHFVDKAQARRQIREQLQNHQRILYFANQIYELDKLSEMYDCPREKIIMVFSDAKKLKELEKKCKADYDRMMAVQEYLNRHSRIQEDIALFVTTSKNKEGINIIDEDIHHVYIESHSMTDIRQMAGRIRCGAEHVYIITDAAEVRVHEAPIEDSFARLMCDADIMKDPVPGFINYGFQRECLKCGLPDLMGNKHYVLRKENAAHKKILAYINDVLKKFPYLQYDYFSNTFQYNRYRSMGVAFSQKEKNRLDQAFKDPDRLVELFGEYFPDTIIHNPYTRLDEAREYIEDCIGRNTKGYFTEEEKNIMIRWVHAKIGDLVRKKKSSTDARIKDTILHSIGYTIRRLCNDPNSNTYSRYEIASWIKEDASAA